MKRLLIIIDGMDDEPNPMLRNMTPAYFADMPALRYMRDNGYVCRQNTIPAGNPPGTEVAVLNILGYDVPTDFSSRSWLEALGLGIEINKDDLCLRCNLITHRNGTLTSHCGEGVTERQCHEIVDLLNTRFGNDRMEFHGNGDFRNLLVVHDAHASLRAEAPHTMIGKPVSHLNIQSTDMALGKMLNRCITESRNVLKDYPANGISLWAPGRALPPSANKRNGAVIAGVNVIKGIGRYVGLSVIDVPGATGDEYTDYRAKLRAALDTLKKYDFALLHIEAPDEASHGRDCMKKVRVLEDIDRKLLTPLLREASNIEITVQSDHATSSRTGMHLDIPVEVITYKID